MTIRFHLPSRVVEQIAFAYSPLQEAVLSLHVLVEPKHHALQHAWVRAMRSLSPTLKREIAAHAFLYRSYLPSFLLPGPTGPLRSFEEELTAMCALPADILRLGFTRHLGDWPDLVEDGGDLARLAGEEPQELARRFADLLSAYWEAGFCKEWERIEPDLGETVAAAGRQLRRGSVFPVGPALAGSAERSCQPDVLGGARA